LLRRTNFRYSQISIIHRQEERTHMNPRALFLCAALAATSLASPLFAQPIATRIANVPDTYHGTVVNDSYRWLEDVKSNEVQTWMRSQADATSRVLGSIAGREPMLKRMLQAENAVAARVLDVTVAGSGQIFFTRREAGAAQPILYVRNGQDGSDRVLMRLADRGDKTGLDYFFPSPDGKLMAYGISQAGSERAALYVMDVETGRDIAGPFADAMWNGNTRYKWENNSRAFSFITLRDEKSYTDKADTFKFMRTWRWDARTPTTPTLTFDAAQKRGHAMTESESSTVFQFPGSPWEFVYVGDGVRRDLRALKRRIGANEAFTPFIEYENGVRFFQVRGDTVFALSRIGAPRFQIVATSLANPDWARAKVVMPNSQMVVEQIAAAKDALYVAVRDGAQARLFRVNYETFAREEIALPFPGSLRLHNAGTDVEGMLIALSGWTQTTQHYAIGAKDKTPRLTTLQPKGAGDAMAGISSRVEMAKSHDGVMVPISIVQKEGAPKNGNTPTLIWAYGAYGFSQNPAMRSEYAGWLDAGYAYATCHVRGGGEYGNEWYEAGKITTKRNTWMDMIACAEHLIATKVTSPGKLAIAGRSAGGITVGRAITERPDLFAAAAPGVGVLDAVRAETEANGPGNTPEFGTVKKLDEFKALLAMSAYHHVKPGVKYPGVILTHGVNDMRVAVWHSSKMGAALQAAHPDAKPALLDLDYNAGHGRGSSREQQLGSFANVLAFFLWQMGEPGFQPRNLSQ
jgi:prolyl oligopeptidase